MAARKKPTEAYYLHCKDSTYSGGIDGPYSSLASAQQAAKDATEDEGQDKVILQVVGYTKQTGAQVIDGLPEDLP